ncbi:MAG: hypothetical protein K9G76_05595 [Bacteroidales bacterium]|nr:hypothetical protein [Bacteroidales bacterium]MCF8403154.1 hypothetical protein [Bacteroidales bacterium]
MKTRIAILSFVAIGFILFESFYTPSPPPLDDEYIIIGWNDLGMHCANQDFSKVVVLPPYNTLYAQVIKRGSASNLPEIVTSGVSVAYNIPGNTYSVGKTNFWDYEDQLFGVNLPDNIGLTGSGLSGEMEIHENYYKIEGIPITPYTDNNLLTEDPFQLAYLELLDDQNNSLAFTQPVIPVSNEINCVSSGCHSSENDILYEHDNEGGYDPTNTPILCASCHSSNGLGTPGSPGVPSLSEAIHDKHKELTNDCYKCHPGPNTQCQRGVMSMSGMVCQDCHGTMTQVAESIKDGREPWLDEPKCGSIECHGPDYAEEPGKLYRLSKGHGELFCSTCHGSPHAIVPTTTPQDNQQNIMLQGFEGTLQRCETCHGVVPTEAGPHGILPPSSITNLNIKVNIEGPFNGTEMESYLNTGLQLPLVQPYSGSPWNYSGTESVTSLPTPDIVDWVLVELRETAGDASTAYSTQSISKRAGFLLKDGSIVDIDGLSPLQFPVPVYANLFTVVWHRNHIGVMSANTLMLSADVFSYDFTTSSGQAYGGLSGYKELGTGIYGMVGGDANADGIVELADKDNFWNLESGNFGYFSSDFDLNSQVNNTDKNQVWLPNSGSGTQVPSGPIPNLYSCMVPQ